MKGTWVAAVLLIACGVAQAAQPVDLARTVEPDGAVRVDIRYGRIHVVGVPGGELRVTGEIDDELFRVSLDREAGAVEIRARLPWLQRLQSLWGDTPAYEVDLRVEVPHDTRLFVVSRDAEITIEGVTGPIGVGVVSSSVMIRGEPSFVDLETVSGSFEFRGMTPRLTATSLSGDLRVVGFGEQVKLEAATGALALLDTRIGRASLTTVSGDVEVRGTFEADGRLHIESQSGSVILGCGEDESVAFDLDTRDGEIVNDVTIGEPIRDDRGHRVLNTAGEGGGASARVRTRSGLIRLVRPSNDGR